MQNLKLDHAYLIQLYLTLVFIGSYFFLNLRSDFYVFINIARDGSFSKIASWALNYEAMTNNTS